MNKFAILICLFSAYINATELKYIEVNGSNINKFKLVISSGPVGGLYKPGINTFSIRFPLLNEFGKFCGATIVTLENSVAVAQAETDYRRNSKNERGEFDIFFNKGSNIDQHILLNYGCENGLPKILRIQAGNL